MVRKENRLRQVGGARGRGGEVLLPGTPGLASGTEFSAVETFVFALALYVIHVQD